MCSIATAPSKRNATPKKKLVFDRFDLQLLWINDRVGEHAIFMCLLLTNAPCNNQEEGDKYKLCREGMLSHALTTSHLHSDLSAKIEGGPSRGYWYKRGHYDDLVFSFHSNIRKHASTQIHHPFSIIHLLACFSIFIRLARTIIESSAACICNIIILEMIGKSRSNTSC